MGTYADHDKLIVAKSGTPLAGRTDGIGILPNKAGDDTTHDGVVVISNGDVARALDPSLLCEVVEDFLGEAKIPEVSTSDVGTGPWAYKDVSAAGSPTAALVADADNGQWAFTFDSQAEAQTLELFFDDELNIDAESEPVIIARVQVVDQTGDALDAASKVCIGLGSAHAADPDDVAQNAWIMMAGANNNIYLESDDATTDTDDQDSGEDYVADTWYEFMVSMSAVHGASSQNVKFFYRSTLGGDWTELSVSGTTFNVLAGTNLQPKIVLYKSSDANTDGILIDYVRCYWKRS